MFNEAPLWTNDAIYESLHSNTKIKLVCSSVDKLDQATQIQLIDFPDTPVIVAVQGEQIILSVLLWPLSGVENRVELDELLLTKSKEIPLSSFGIIDHLDERYYELFGALSAKAGESLTTISDISIELDVLARNISGALDLIMSVEG